MLLVKKDLTGRLTNMKMPQIPEIPSDEELSQQLDEKFNTHWSNAGEEFSGAKFVIDTYVAPLHKIATRQQKAIEILLEKIRCPSTNTCIDRGTFEKYGSVCGACSLVLHVQEVLKGDDTL